MKKLILFSVGGLTVLILAATAETAPAPAHSSFDEVWAVVTQPPPLHPDKMSAWEILQHRDQLEDLEAYGTAKNPRLPQHSGGLDAFGSLISGALKKAAIRTMTNKDDYRDYFQKLVHANGTCFSGTWQITEPTTYTGLFAGGSQALMIGRISTASPQTSNDDKRSFGFAGKLFPTKDRTQKVATANFFTVDHLNGTDAYQVLDVAFTNEPPVDLSGLLNPLRLVNAVFELADENPGFRPLYPLARAGLAAGEKPVTPQWMRISPAADLQERWVQDADFRDELSPINYPRGLRFNIEVSETTKDPKAESGWLRIGEIRTSSTVVSFGCDRRLHFPHMKLKDPQ